jgi:CRISPR-associated protein Cmr2
MKYIGLTIGPIYKTLQNSKKPKELWSASYIFSYIMRNIIQEFKSRNFVTPYIKDSSIFDNTKVGLFHDRFIFESQDGDLELLKICIDKVLEDLSHNSNLNVTIDKEFHSNDKFYRLTEIFNSLKGQI